MTPYPTYKHSGIEWIGEIPEHWDNVSLKHLVSIKITDGPHETPEFIEAGVPFMSAEAVKNGKIDFNYKRGYISKETDIEYSKKCKPQIEDIFIVKSGSTTGKIAYVDFEDDFNIWSPLAIVRANYKVVSKYLYHAFTSEYFQKSIQLNWSFGTQPNIGMNVIENLRVLLPPLPEQQAIARFLDERTEKIDRLIANKQRLIALLREERTGLINHAVTRGLDKDTPLQPSGIDWLGDIPKHWEVKKLKYVVSKIDEIVDFSDFTIAVENIESYSGKLVGLDEEKNYSGALSAFRKNDVIFNKLRPYLCKVYFAEQDGACYGELLILRGLKKVINNHFLFFRLISDAFISEVNSSTEGTKMPRANWEDFIKHLFIPIPPIAEQQAIATYITKETRKIDHAIGRIEQEIALMQEYRAALISEVVTGKINVSEQNPKQRGKQQVAHHIGNLNDN